jgi:hypothetical protein
VIGLRLAPANQLGTRMGKLRVGVLRRQRGIPARGNRRVLSLAGRGLVPVVEDVAEPGRFPRAQIQKPLELRSRNIAPRSLDIWGWILQDSINRNISASPNFWGKPEGRRLVSHTRVLVTCVL